MAITEAMPLAPPVSPQEGLQVAYNAAVQTIVTNSIPFLALLLVGLLLFLARLSDDEDENLDFERPDPGFWWFYG
jgi:hypothetical protein